MSHLSNYYQILITISLIFQTIEKSEDRYNYATFLDKFRWLVH